MIKSFRHKGLQVFFETGSKASVQAKHTDRLQVLLTALNAATVPEDMCAPAWKLHKLSGKNPKGQSVQGHWAVSVSGNWRITFRYFGGLSGLPLGKHDAYAQAISPRHCTSGLSR